MIENLLLKLFIQYINIVRYYLGNVAVIRGCSFDTSFYLTFRVAELQLYIVQIYNT
jgi:hypothetical protein